LVRVAVAASNRSSVADGVVALDCLNFVVEMEAMVLRNPEVARKVAVPVVASSVAVVTAAVVA